jgi:hypothetical protein
MIVEELANMVRQSSQFEKQNTEIPALDHRRIVTG